MNCVKIDILKISSAIDDALKSIIFSLYQNFSTFNTFAHILKVDKLAEPPKIGGKSAENATKKSPQKCINYTNLGFPTTNCQNKASLYKKCLYSKQIKHDKRMERQWCSVVLMVFAFSA